MSKHSFIRRVYRDMRDHKVIVDKVNASYIVDNNGNSYGGGFSDTPLRIELSMKVSQRDFLSILVHEYSHFLQWKQKSPFWFTKYRGLSPWVVLERWLGGREYKDTTIIECIERVRKCELDCDRIAVGLIKEYDLPINIYDYCRSASAYQYFYHYVRITRQWEYEQFPPYIRSVLDLMPSNLNDGYEDIPDWLENYFKLILVPCD